MKVQVYSFNNNSITSAEVPQSMAGKINMALLAQSNRVYENRRHPGLSKTKTRAQINISKIKIFKQKGTGHARHGAKSAPIFVGGGIAHGPKGIKRIYKLSDKLKNLSKVSAFSLKAKEEKLILLDGVSSVNSTKKAFLLMKKIMQDKKAKKAVFYFALQNKEQVRFFKNINNIKVANLQNANAYDILWSSLVVVDNQAFEPVKKTNVDKPIKKIKKGKK